MSRRVLGWSVALGLLGAALGCDPTTPKGFPSRAGFARSNAFYERMALLLVNDNRARLRGFDGAVPAGTVVAMLNGEGTTVATATADENGRFEMEADAFRDQVFVVRPGLANVSPLEFAARRRVDALRQSIQPRLAGTGSTPNHVLIPSDASVEGDTPAYVVLSGDNAVDNVMLDSASRARPLVPLEDVQSPGGPLTAAPWRAFARGSTVWVTRYGQGTFSTLDANAGTVKATSNALPLQDLVPPLALAPAADANGDGVEESLANQLLPRHPTDILVMDNVAYVTFANVLTTAASGNSQYGPGLLAAYDLRGDGTPTGVVRVVRLSYVNPQAVMAHPDGDHVVVSSTGALHRDATWRVESDGGLDVVTTRDLTLAGTVNLGAFAPSRPVMLTDGKSVYVPSLLRAQLARVDLTTRAVTLGPGAALPALQLLPTEDLRSTFECALHPTGLVLCAVFDQDALVFVDPRQDQVNPWPFSEPLVIPENAGDVRWGLQGLAIRPGRNGVDRVGVDVVFLFSLASRLSAMDTRWVLGP